MKQYYRKILGIEKYEFNLVNKGNNISVKTIKLKEYKNVYISNKTHIKPRALQNVIKRINDAIKEYKIKNTSLKIVILNNNDSFYSYGQYDAIDNVVYYNDVITNKIVLGLENIELGHIERHEIWHFKQAEIFRDKYGDITNENYDDYISFISLKAKSHIDSMKINEDNVGEISEYALKAYRVERYDEVEAEIKAKKGTK